MCLKAKFVRGQLHLSFSVTSKCIFRAKIQGQLLMLEQRWKRALFCLTMFSAKSKTIIWRRVIDCGGATHDNKLVFLFCFQLEHFLLCLNILLIKHRILIDEAVVGPVNAKTSAYGSKKWTVHLIIDRLRLVSIWSWKVGKKRKNIGDFTYPPKNAPSQCCLYEFKGKQLFSLADINGGGKIKCPLTHCSGLPRCSSSARAGSFLRNHPRSAIFLPKYMSQQSSPKQLTIPNKMFHGKVAEAGDWGAVQVATSHCTSGTMRVLKI